MSIIMAECPAVSNPTENEQGSYLTEWPPIRLYVCCTPKDFQAERDHLAQCVFPQLNQLCRVRGTYLKAVDLVWPSEEAHSDSSNGVRHHASLVSQQLKLSLDYINSVPFFICMLGHTYGEFRPENAQPLPTTCADHQGLSKVERNLYTAANTGYPWVLQDPSRSLTELEITQARFLKDTPFQYFYFRDYQYIEERLQNAGEEEQVEVRSMFTSKSEYEELRIRELKARIIDKGLTVRFFSDLCQLGDLVLKDWSEVIECLHPSSLVHRNIGYEHSLALAHNEAFSANLCDVFVASQQSAEMFDLFDVFALGGNQSDTWFSDANQETGSMRVASPKTIPSNSDILLLCGERGSGKSSIVASWAKSFKKKHLDICVISYYVGNSGGGGSDDVMSFMKHCISELRRDHFGAEHRIMAFSENTSDVWEFSLVVDIFLASVALKPCILVLDGIDELAGICGLPAPQAKDFSWLPRSLPLNVKLILTTVSSHLSFKSLSARSDVHLVTLAPMAGEDTRIHIFQKHLAMPYRETSPLHLMRKLLENRLRAAPLQLALWASELRVCGGYRTETQSIEEFTEAQSLQDTWDLVLKRWEKDYGWTCERKKPSKRKKMPSAPPVPGSSARGWVSDVLCLLSISHCGLAEHEIFQLLRLLGYTDECEVTPLHWAAFRAATFKWISETPDGLLCFSHWTLRHAIESRILGVLTPVKEGSATSFWNPANEGKIALHQLLAQHFQKEVLSRRVYDELPWHLKMSGNWKDLYDFLSHPRTVDLIDKELRRGEKMKVDLVRYWQVLSAAGFDPAVGYVHRMQTVACVLSSWDTETRARFLVPTESDCEFPVSTVWDQCRLQCCAAEILNDIGKINATEELFLSAEALLSQDALKDPMTAQVLFRIQSGAGEMYSQCGSQSEAICYFQKAQWTLGHLRPDDFTSNADLRRQKGQLLWNLMKAMVDRHPEQRLEMLLEAVRHFKSFAAGPFERATLQLLLGLQAYYTDNFPVAERYLEECLGIRRSLYGKSHLLVGETLEYLADVQSHPKNNHQRLAIEHYKQAIKIKEKAALRKTCSRGREQLRLKLSTTLYKLGQLLHDHPGCQTKREAWEYLQRSLDLRICIVGPDHPLTEEVQCVLKEIKKEGTGNGSTWLSDLGWPETSKHRRRPQSCPISQSAMISPVHKPQSAGNKQLINLPTVSHDVWRNVLLGGSRSSKNEPLSTSREVGAITHFSPDNAEIPTHIQTLASRMLTQETIPNSWVSPASQVSWSVPKRATSATERSKSCVGFRSTSPEASAFSGPQSSIDSLHHIGTSESASGCHNVLHKSAWYHVPGRYPTRQSPVPPKRHQIRKLLH